MKLEKKVKRRIDANLDRIAKNPYEKKRGLSLWPKILIPVGGLALAASVTLAITLPLASVQNVPELNRLTTPRMEKVREVPNEFISKTTYDSYMAFTRKFTDLMMEVNNGKNEKSMGVSIPDAYICLAIMGVISSDAAREDVMSYLELDTMDDLRTSVKEIVTTFCALSKDYDGNFVGGYNLNSVWLDPEQVALVKEKDEELYKDLEEVFDASIYYEALTSKAANQYLEDNGLEGMPTPEIKLDDERPSPLSTMSVYYCLDHFKREEKIDYKREFQSGTHLMNYEAAGKKSRVDFIEQKKEDVVFEGDDFYGARMNIGNILHMSYFLPNEKTALPSSILDDVLNENYHLKESTYSNPERRGEFETTTHNVVIDAPYFSLDNKLDLERSDLKKILPVITTMGAGARLVSQNPQVDGFMFLNYLKQFSVMKFNYDGFYSCSVTIAGTTMDGGDFYDPGYEEFKLILNHPYVFEVERRAMYQDPSDEAMKIVNVPLVIGEIVTPEYVD